MSKLVWLTPFTDAQSQSAHCAHDVVAIQNMENKGFLSPCDTEGAMESASVLVFTTSFAYNFVRK